MRTFTRTVIMAGVVAACVGLVAPAAGAAEAKPIRALVVTGGHDYDVKEFPKVFEGLEGITAVQAPQKDSTVFDSIDGWAYDAIVLYNFAQGINEKQQANLLALLDKGVGLVILHHAVAAYPKWPEYRAILGGRYYLDDEEEGGVKRPRCTYLHDVDFKVHVEDPNHPVTRGLADFEIHDETYHGYTMDPKVKVLLTTDEKTSEKAVAWCHPYKNAKVCFIQLGHDAKAYANPAFSGLVANAIRWVAGRDAGAPAPAADAEGFMPLLSGKDLAGWKADDEMRKHWAVVDGVLQYDGKSKDLWTEKAYKDFILKVEWRLPAPGDSGIYLRGSSKCQANIWCDALGSGEVYGYRTDNAQPEEVRKACAPSKKADKPVGEWNAFVITMKGDRLTVVLNGETVISNAQLPDCPKEGPIALQNHGNPLEFRNIWIKELP